jgi:hypothetical protein
MLGGLQVAGSLAKHMVASHTTQLWKTSTKNALNIYIDGSSYSAPRVGGAGFLFIRSGLAPGRGSRL